jgi:hypothetical protein
LASLALRALLANQVRKSYKGRELRGIPEVSPEVQFQIAPLGMSFVFL